MRRLPPIDPTVRRPGAWGTALLAALAIPACGTQEIGTDQVVLVGAQTDPSQGGLMIIVAPAAPTFAEAQSEVGPSASEPWYHLLIDGKELMYDDPLQPVTVVGGGAYSAGFQDAGLHHFTLVSLDSPAVFTADGVIASGAVNRLYLFGPADRRETRFITNAVAPPSSQEHVSAINLVQSGGVQIEVVSCSEAAACAPVSPPLGLGGTFDADLPASGGTPDGELSLSGSGTGYGYRQVATTSLPNPPVLSMMPALTVGPPEPGLPPSFVAAPIYMAADGSVLSSSF